MTSFHTYVMQRAFLQGRVVVSVERGRKSFEKFFFFKKNKIKKLDNVNKVCYPPLICLFDLVVPQNRISCDFLKCLATKVYNI